MISALTGEPIDDPLLREERRRERQKVDDREETLRPDGQRTNPWMQRALQLANLHECELYTDDHAWARHTARAIGTPPIESAEALAQFVHEIGHLERRVDDPDMFVVKTSTGSVEHSLLNEVAAWRFAISALKRDWSTAMQAEMEYCLRSHAPTVVRTRTDRELLEKVIAEGRDAVRLRGVVRIK